MKVIFLDVEGVLNTRETYERAYRLHGHTTMIDLELDMFRIGYLKQIIDETGAKIVLSSSFRYFFHKEDDKVFPVSLKGKRLYDNLRKYDVEIYDITPTTMGSREDQVKEWLSNRDDIESFVIIDDDANNFDELYSNLIQTSTMKRNYLSSFMKESTGLCERHIPEAIDKLNQKTKVLNRYF
ncbi:MAG: hypothetical protein IJE04_01105 [Bacilli bacterium]|nr:hypothetical protein [Bacilli bacterium]